MFDREYIFRGKHAEMVRKLTIPFSKKELKIFNRNIDVYLFAPVVGFLYSRKSMIDKSDDTTKIFVEQLIKNSSLMWMNYRLIMMLDTQHESDDAKRIEKAFRNYSTELSKVDEELFDSYVLGGVEVLYEKLVEPCKSEEDFLIKFYEFIEEIHERYNEDLSSDDILDLCIRVARE